MRTIIITALATAGAVGILAAVAIGTASASAAPSPASVSTNAAVADAGHHGGGHGQKFTVVEHADTDTTADTGPAGDSLGDVLAFANPVYNAANTVKVGTDNGSCIRTVVGAAYECTWTTTLAGGSLVVTGPFYDTRDSVLAVTGGTGKYVGATGEMRLHARNAQGTAYDFAFDLS